MTISQNALREMRSAQEHEPATPPKSDYELGQQTCRPCLHGMVEALLE